MPSYNAMTPAQKQLFNEIQDIIGPAAEWPRNIMQYFLFGVPQGKGLGHKLRPQVACFFWINGLNPLVFLEWCALCPLAHPYHAQLHYKWLFDSFDRGYMAYRYAWNVALGHYQNMNGTYCDIASRKQSS